MKPIDPIAAANLRTPEWYKTATRWTQLTLVENDPVKFDPDFWIDVFQRTRSNAVCLSAGGYIGFYPSKVPLHYVSKYLGDTDPFGRLVDGARSLGMHVMARVDPHAIHQDAADTHPEWIAVDKDGNPRRHWAFPDVWVTCAYGDYNNVFMPNVVKEITRDYDIDALFANRWQGHGVCYCESCKTRFKGATGFDLPMTSDVNDPAWRAWSGWRREVLTRMVIAWDNDVKAIRPHASFIPNMGGESLMEFDIGLIEKHCPFLVVDHQGRRGLEPIWLAGRNAKRMRATFRDRPVVLITSIGPEEQYRWKDSVTTGAEIESWIANGVTHGMLPWFTKFNGVVPDERWVAPVAAGFEKHEKLQAMLEATTPTAEIAIIDPTTTLKNWARDERRQAEGDDLGFYHALIEAKLPFEFLSDEAMTAESLDRFKLVILANASNLSDAQCALLRDYAARGGSLIAAHETAMRDESGNARDAFALGDVFGVKRSALARGPVKNSYIVLSGDHPLTQGYEGAGRIIGGTMLAEVETVAGTETPFLSIPDFPDLPMEEVYPREEPRGAAVVTRETTAGGRTVYIPWNIGSIFWEVLTADHQRLIENAVRWAMGGTPRVSVSGHSVLDIAVRESGDTLAVLLFNLTNPMMFKGPTRSIYPVGPHTVSIAIPKGRSVRDAQLLIAGKTAEYRAAGDTVEVDVPQIDLLETVEVRWS
ncbi:alpha-amylase family protein [Martelella sp. FLE1502]